MGVWSIARCKASAVIADTAEADERASLLPGLLQFSPIAGANTSFSRRCDGRELVV